MFKPCQEQWWPITIMALSKALNPRFFQGDCPCNLSAIALEKTSAKCLSVQLCMTGSMLISRWKIWSAENNQQLQPVSLTLWASASENDWKLLIVYFFFCLLHQMGVKLGDFCCIIYMNTQKIKEMILKC